MSESVYYNILFTASYPFKGIRTIENVLEAGFEPASD